MPKIVKGLAGRTPPTPSESHAVIDECLGSHMPGIQPVVAEVDRMIVDAIPGLQFAVVRGRPYYGLPKQGWIIELAPYHVSMNILFFGGADFAEPPPLGEVDRTRYIKIATVEDAQRPEIADWIAESAQIPGWK